MTVDLEPETLGSMLPWKGTDRLRRFRRFCSEFLTIPTGFGAGGPLDLYPTQVEWARAFTRDPIVVIVVGRGNTKSTLAAAVAIWAVVDCYPGDQRPEVVIVANSALQAKGGIYGAACAMVANSPALSAVSHQYRDLADPRLSFDNGGTIRVRSANAERLQGMVPSVILADEIASFDPKVWATLIQSLGKRPGASLLGISTPSWSREILHKIKDDHDSGRLGDGFTYLEHSADPDPDLVGDPANWLRANPVRAQMDPAGWVATLRLIRTSVPAAEFGLMNLCLWSDVRGVPIIDPDQWDEAAGPTVDLDDPDTFEMSVGLHVAVAGDWSRRNVAVIGALLDDDVVNIVTLGLWIEAEVEVPTADILAAVEVTGPPVSITVAKAQQAGELVDALEADGSTVEAVSTVSPTVMREATDRLLSAISSGDLRHDDNPLLRGQVLAARTDVAREGILLARDDRQLDRIDGVIAMALAVQAARTAPVVQIY